ncbi:MAG: ABC transporter ATP-binding protein [Anaerolineales bacterium]
MIRVRDLTVRYPGASAPALHDLTLDVPTGELVLLLGPSGSGKSTLALTLAGLIPHSVFAEVQGDVEVDGVRPLLAGPAECATHAGLLFQDPQSGFATLTVEDEIAFGLENLCVPRNRLRPRIRAALAATGMARFAPRPLAMLSAGEAQRVALAALLAMDPPVLLLDEPTAHLDPAATREFFSTLRGLKRSRTIILIEHKLDACLPLADRVALLTRDGGRLAEGVPGPTLRRFRKAILESGAWLPQSLEPKTRPRPRRVTASSRRANPAVSVRGLSFAYPGGPPILRRLDLEVPAGSFTALVGPNGSGKSTLAKAMMGLLPRGIEGDIRVFDQRVGDLDPRELAGQVGFVFQNPEHQFVRDTVAEDVAYSLEVRQETSASVRVQVHEILKRFGLLGLEDRNPFTLSQGEKRRLSVAEMLAAGQRLLILDEPTYGQDRKSTFALMDSLAELNRRGVTIIVITHDVRFVRRYTDTAAVLVDGRIAFQGSPGQLFRRPVILSRARLR